MHERNGSSDQVMGPGSVLAGENSAIVNKSGTEMHGGIPLQESGDSEMPYPQPAQVGSNINNIMVHDPVAASEDELGGMIIAVQLLVMSVDTIFFMNERFDY